MIYTVTFSPAIDYIVHMDELVTGGINRAERTAVFFGGKGINVSTVLKELGVPSRALGFVAGFTGEAIEKGVAEKGIETDFIHLDHGFSRINVKIKTEKEAGKKITKEAGRETELNGQGPVIGEEALEALYTKLERLEDGDTLVLAGSVPDSMPADVYEKILKRLSDKRIKTVVDATRDLLKNVLKYRPFLIKPNHHELGELFGVTLRNDEEIAEYAARLKSMGAGNVLVSKAEKGAVLLDENGVLHTCGACRGTVINSVGAGDSMVAGFLAGAARGDYEYALRLGTAAGGATAFSEELAQKKEILELLQQLT